MKNLIVNQINPREWITCIFSLIKIIANIMRSNMKTEKIIQVTIIFVPLKLGNYVLTSINMYRKKKYYVIYVSIS